MAQQLDIIERVSDEVSIAQGLLGAPIIPPRRRTSFTSTSRSAYTRDASSEFEESTSINDEERRRRMVQSSNTWTASSGEILSDKDDVEDRTFFVLEYNRLAMKHGVRTLIPEDFDSSKVSHGNTSNKSGSWFYRKILRKSSSTQSVKTRTDRLIKHRRSISDLSLRLKPKHDTLKDKDLQELVRLCGLSLLYLPTDYAANSLAVPTCFRATAQYLVQHASTARGVFRIPGSHNVVAALYNHYCTMDEHGAVVSGTVRCPTLPEHIRCDVHDVASAFKKFISGVPGGILGSLPLFDAFISIQSQLNSMPELTRTKQSKVRARLIALAIATLRSQYRRELICAVFGLLSMIGRAAEIAPRENEHGRPLPTSDLMGYGPLGIVFGPLLVGDLLEKYTMRLANPHGGLVLLPISPPKSRKERSKKNKTSEDCSAFNIHVDKIRIANSITEMLITHWRDVIRHMKNLKALKIVRSYKSLEGGPSSKQPPLRPSASESFALRKPPDWNNENSPMRQVERCESPTPTSRTDVFLGGRLSGRASPKSNDTLNVRKQRSRPRHLSSQMLSGTRSRSILSPTKEENVAECPPDSDRPSGQENNPITQPTLSNSEVHHFSTNFEAANPADGSVEQHQLEDCPPIEIPSKILKVDESQPLQTHALRDCSAPTKSTYILKGERLKGPRDTELLASGQTYPHITLSLISPSSHAKPGALRRIPASEPGLAPNVPAPRPLRASKSTHGDSAHQISVRDWTVPRDPLARVSAQEDLASLAELAHVLKKETVQVESSCNNAEKLTRRKLVEPGGNPIEDDIKRVYRKVEALETKETMIQEEIDFTRIAREAFSEAVGGTLSAEKLAMLHQRLEELEERLRDPSIGGKSVSPLKAPARYKPKPIEGPNYNHFSRSTPSPKKLSFDQLSIQSGSPAGAKYATLPVASQRTSLVQVHIEENQAPVIESPRLSVKDLAAKFNTGESRSLTAPSPTKSLSKATSVDIRAVSDSPKEKIIAPYKINPSSPTKSQKSGISEVSLQSVGIQAPIDRNLAKSSPPRRLLRANLNDTTPLRSVPKRSSAALQPPDLPACCSPPVSAARFSLYDGSSSQTQQSSSEAITCPSSAHVHFEPREIIAATEKVAITSNIDGTSSVPMAINPLLSPPPTRSNSVLHAQIRSLQQQLNSKVEEVRHLKRQLGSRGNLDIGALSEGLREVKKEMQSWKTRAELAEKQLLVMATLSSRNTSSQTTTHSSSMAVPDPTSAPSRVEYSEEGAVVLERIRRALHGMDGPSSDPNSSECSTETVVRDFQEVAVTGSEYSMWVEHTMKPIDFMVAQGAE